MSYPMNSGRCTVTVPLLQKMRDSGELIAMLTCYDASFAALLERAGVDILLIGDSLGNVLQGQATTLPVKLEDIAYHTAIVSRGSCGNALIISDLPFGSYGTFVEAYSSAVRLIKAGAQMVKLEGGLWVVDTIRFLVERSIPVCAHLGLTPQSVHTFGGFKVQGKNDLAAEQLKKDAESIERAGAQLLILEAIPAALGAQITALLTIPTIGIGAGSECSGQVLVLYDMLGLTAGKLPRFVKNFMISQPSIEEAVYSYVRAVKEGTFPAKEHTF
ncbi:3-methyl-2-oxobutanoate hydroxymethyltransferase [Candidatus Vallotia tarda]|nr:3-methyl-2-oxobutanoate hydroxymethyltransferase [Candidatus Vallotia tarda]